MQYEDRHRIDIDTISVDSGTHNISRQKPYSIVLDHRLDENKT